MIVNDRLRLVYLAIPRTGSVATQRALLRLPGSRTVGRERHYMRVPPECAGFHVLTTVRNPYARIASHWAKLRADNHRRGYDSFAAFVARLQRRERGVSERPMVAWLGRNRPTVVMRQESLADDLTAFFADLGVPAPPLRRENASGRDWRAVYNADLAERVHAWSRVDFERFGYAVGSWR